MLAFLGGVGPFAASCRIDMIFSRRALMVVNDTKSRAQAAAWKFRTGVAAAAERAKPMIRGRKGALADSPASSANSL
jgi:hypothetical protein